MSMTSEWFYGVEDRQFGPVSSERLKELASSGELSPDSLVWKKGMAQWKVAAAVKGLFRSSHPVAVVPPPIPQQGAAHVDPHVTPSSPIVALARSAQRPKSNQAPLWLAAGGAVVVLALIVVFALSSGLGTSRKGEPISSSAPSTPTPTRTQAASEFEATQLASLPESDETGFKRLNGQRLLVNGIVESSLTRKLDGSENTLLRLKGSSTLGVWCDLSSIEPHSDFLVGKLVALEGTFQGLGRRPIGSTESQQGHVWLTDCKLISPSPELLAAAASVDKPASGAVADSDEYHARLRDSKRRTRAELIRSVERYLSNASILPMSRTPDVPLADIAELSTHEVTEQGPARCSHRIQSHITIYGTTWEHLFGDKLTFKSIQQFENEGFIDGIEWTVECSDGPVRFIGSREKTPTGAGFRVFWAEFNMLEPKAIGASGSVAPTASAAPPDANHPHGGIRVIKHHSHAQKGFDVFARHDGQVFDVGIGEKDGDLKWGPGWGCGMEGVEIEHAESVKVTILSRSTYRRIDPNSFAGFFIDYRTPTGYAKRVAFSVGVADKERSGAEPPWGRVAARVDQIVDLESGDSHSIRLADYAPSGWDGRIIFTVAVQNTGPGTSLKVQVEPMGQTSDEPEPTPPPTDALTFRFVAVTLRPDGNGKVVIDTRPENEAGRSDTPEGDAVEVDPLRPAKVFRADDGRLRVIYDFTEFKEIEHLKPPNPDAQTEAMFRQIRRSDEGLLVLTPNDQSRATLPLPRSVQGAIEFNFALADLSSGLATVQFNMGRHVLVLSLHGADSVEKELPGTVVLSQRAAGQEFKVLLKATQQSGKREEHSFRIPAEWMQLRTWTSIGIAGRDPVSIRSIDITAKFPPSFGMELADSGNRVSIKRVIVGGAGETAGIRAGDVILSINGTSVTTGQAAMQALAESPLDKPAEIIIQRAGARRTISVTPK